VTNYTQEDVETSILLMLAEEARTSNRRLRSSAIAKKFVPNVGETQVKLALDHLVKQGLASSSFDNPSSSGFQITRNGIIAVENNFDRVDDGENSSYRPKPPAFSNEDLNSLAAEGTYVFPAPPDGPAAEDSPPAPVIINNYVSPTFSNSNVSTADPEAGRVAKSGARAGWANVWVAVIAAVAVILVTLWAAGKLHF
jgi:hypothetical protein